MRRLNPIKTVDLYDVWYYRQDGGNHRQHVEISSWKVQHRKLNNFQRYLCKGLACRRIWLAIAFFPFNIIKTCETGFRRGRFYIVYDRFLPSLLKNIHFIKAISLVDIVRTSCCIMTQIDSFYPLLITCCVMLHVNQPWVSDIDDAHSMKNNGTKKFFTISYNLMIFNFP